MKDRLEYVLDQLQQIEHHIVADAKASHDHHNQMFGFDDLFDPYVLKTTDGKYLMVDVVVAKANVLAALAGLEKTNG